MAYKSVNRAVPRIEGADKVSGNMRYAADLKFPNALAAKILRTSLPHARIVSIDTSKAAKLRGVRAIITGADVKGVMVGLRMKDMPLLADAKVRYAGEPVAAVAADSDEIAEEALNLIDVEYQQLPFVTDPVESTKVGAPVLHDNPKVYKNAPDCAIDLPNVQSYGKWSNGDVDAGFKKAARVFEHTFRTPLGFHGYIEPHACTVQVHDDGRVEIWASNKAPFSLRTRFARDVGIEESKVNVQILPVGGDFGGKTSVAEAPICYFLAKKTGKAVRLVLEYTEEVTAISHRHPAVITLRTGVDGENKICAMAIKAVFSGGGYAALKANAEVTVQGPRRAASYYRFPAIQVETLCAYTNQVPCTQTRTPGSPQTTFAVESQIDIIARELGLDPVKFRMLNLLNAGDPTPFGQKLQGIVVKETLSKALEVSGWNKPKAKNVGRGVAVYERPSGAGKSGAAITVASDGSLSVHLGVPDVGPGIHTVVQQIVSEVLDLPRDRVSVRVGDTDSSPYDSGTGGSKSTNSVGTAAYQAVTELKEKLLVLAAAKFGCKREQIEEVKGRYNVPGQKPMSCTDMIRGAIAQNGGALTHLSIYEPARAPITSFAAQVAEVEVDLGTGQVKVTKLTTVHDSGTVLNHLSYTGQIDGGIINGMGFALMEDNSLVDGKMPTVNLGEFKMACIADVPKLTTFLMETPAGPIPYQGKAIAEIPNVPTAAAIANAVQDACGVRIVDLPITAEKVYAALKR
ncbi:MAG: xanthine dehydrogenase family protein molybdopterin-binding subunit [Deltaproteobacteria bacterium]|nr:xanthine dehydrogenase family protein molybdopterin-binding subunit [Deltaproteobacteria bacterium]